MVTDILVQFKVAGVPILKLGNVVFCVTVIDAEAEHPPLGSLTVTE